MASVLADTGMPDRWRSGEVDVAQAVVVTHLAFEHLGTLAAVLAARGITVDVVEAGLGIDHGRCAQADLLVVLGGPIGVADRARYPVLAAEWAVLEERLARGRPTLGICLGAQLMAAVGGGVVTAGRAEEIGWEPVSLSAAGRASPLRHLDARPVLHWHFDAITELPPRAVGLASSAITQHQAFALGEHALGLQFHLEIEPREFERWLIGHAGALSGRADAWLAEQRRLAAAAAETLPEVARRICHDWLDAAGLPG